MEINRALPVHGKRSFSEESIRQTALYMESAPMRFSFKTPCCGQIRRNIGLSDPGFYLNGGPRCTQLGLTCECPCTHEKIAYADGLIPGCLVYAPRAANQFWPAIVDFCPDEFSHFVIFRLGGPQCCTPYAYYLTFIPDWSGETYGGWFTANYIVPYDTATRTDYRLECNFNDPNFDSAYEVANLHALDDVKDRMRHFAPIVRMMIEKMEKKELPVSAFGRVKEGFLSTATKFSGRLIRRVDTVVYRRVDGVETVTVTTRPPLPTPRKSTLRRIASLILRAFTFRRRSSPTPEAEPEDVDGFGVRFLANIAQDHDHGNEAEEDFIERGSLCTGYGIAERYFKYRNPTRHYKSGSHPVYYRCAVQAAIRSGLHYIRTYDMEHEQNLGA